jgi:hypothetical protein
MAFCSSKVRCDFWLPDNFLFSTQELAARVCEKYGWLDLALEYSSLALLHTPADGATDQRPTTRIWAQTLRGRVLAAQRDTQGAEAAFGEAVALAQRLGGERGRPPRRPPRPPPPCLGPPSPDTTAKSNVYGATPGGVSHAVHLLAACALRDLQACVLSQPAVAESRRIEGQQRLDKATALLRMDGAGVTLAQLGLLPAQGPAGAAAAQEATAATATAAATPSGPGSSSRQLSLLVEGDLLVSGGGQKELVVSVTALSALEQALQASLGVGQQPLVMSVWDPDFEEWIELRHLSEIEGDQAKLCVAKRC